MARVRPDSQTKRHRERAPRLTGVIETRRRTRETDESSMERGTEEEFSVRRRVGGVEEVVVERVVGLGDKENYDEEEMNREVTRTSRRV